MSSQLLTTVKFGIIAEISNVLDLAPSGIKAIIDPSITSRITNGTAISQANRIFQDTRTLGGASNETLDVFDFAGAKDPLGQVYALSRILLLYIRNKGTVSDQILSVGGDGTSAAWNSPWGGDDDGLNVIPSSENGDSILALWGSSLAALAVADTTNHLLKIANAGAASVDYDIVIIGS